MVLYTKFSQEQISGDAGASLNPHTPKHIHIKSNRTYMQPYVRDGQLKVNANACSSIIRTPLIDSIFSFVANNAVKLCHFP